jgi:peptide/nickel transport system substrate-binding protein
MNQPAGNGTTYLRRYGRRQVLRVGGLGIIAGAALRCSPSAGGGAAAPSAPAPSTGGAAAAPATSVPAAPNAKRGGTVRTSGNSGHRHQDLHDVGRGTASYSYLVAYSGLLKFKHGADTKPPAFIPVPDIAESWTQPDELTYTFKLRPGVKFHNIAPVNGREVVAQDFVYSFTRQRDLKAYAPPVVGIAKMEAVDKSTFKVTLDRPDADILAKLADDACRVIAKEAVDLRGDLKEGPTIGTGPWILDQIEYGRSDYLVRNPDYFVKGLPYVDRLEINHLPDQPSVLNAFRGGELDVIGSGMRPEDYDTVMRTTPQAKTHWILQDRTGDEIGFNVTKPPFTDLRVRQAFVKALDFQVVLDTLWKGRGELTTGVVLPDATWKLPKDELQRLFKRDVEGAKRLLREAGMDRGFEVECIMIPIYAGGAYQIESELFQQQLKEVNIQLNLKPLDPVAHQQLTTTGNYQFYVNNQSGQPTTNGDLLGRYHSKGPTNLTKYSDPKMDDLIDKQAVLIRDPEGRKKLLQDIQRYVVDQAFKVGICAAEQPTMYWPHLMNFFPATQVSSQVDYWSDVWLDK